jgi:hypothetical protein
MFVLETEMPFAESVVLNVAAFVLEKFVCVTLEENMP